MLTLIGYNKEEAYLACPRVQWEILSWKM